jgi:hypothetical protein
MNQQREGARVVSEQDDAPVNNERQPYRDSFKLETKREEEKKGERTVHTTILEYPVCETHRAVGKNALLVLRTEAVEGINRLVAPL